MELKKRKKEGLEPQVKMYIDVIKGRACSCSGRELESHHISSWIKVKGQKEDEGRSQVCTHSGTENNGFGNEHRKL